MSSAGHIHAAADTPYGPPVLRAPSPASSVGTRYGPDDTALSDIELGPEEFAQKRIRRIGLDRPADAELEANLSPLIYPRPNSEQEERALSERIIGQLRQRVQQLQENEIFEQTLLRGSQVGLERQPMSSDIDKIMRSMMRLGDEPRHAQTPSPSLMDGTGGAVNGIADGPWNTSGRPMMSRIAERKRRQDMKGKGRRT